jgi:hypothetical protein
LCSWGCNCYLWNKKIVSGKKQLLCSQSDKFDKLKKLKGIIEYWHPYSKRIWCQKKKEVAQRIKIAVIIFHFV